MPMQYGESTLAPSHHSFGSTLTAFSTVRLGKSGLKVSRLILGMAHYGDPRFMPWVLGEEEAFKHIKLA